MATAMLQGKVHNLHINRNLTEEIRNWISLSIDYGKVSRKKPITFHGGICHYDCQLPSQEQMPAAMWTAYEQLILDLDMKIELEREKVLNWSKSTAKLFPFKIPRDGNCLLHSASFAMWGVDDQNHTLRNILKTAMEHGHENSYKTRWWRHRMDGLHGLDPGTSETINREWQDVVSSVNDGGSHPRHCRAIPHEFLESIHIYVLANILRRPIIVLSSPNARSLRGISLQENNIFGVYLPLEWSPSECGKTPLIMGFSFQCSHFCPLLTGYQAGGQMSPVLIPLATQDSVPLPLRCLKESEESQAGQLFQDYLIVKEVNVLDALGSTRLMQCCSMSLKPMPFDVNTVELHFQAFSTEFNHKSASGLRQVSPPRGIINAGGQMTTWTLATSSSETMNLSIGPEASPQCVTPGCQHKGHRTNNGLCTTCLRNYTIAESGTQLVSTKEGDRKVYIPIRMDDQNMEMNEEAERPPASPKGHSERNLIPTAPPVSHNFESSAPVTSMMNERCITSGCGYRCSKQTFPYCHQCNSQKQTLKQPVQPECTENLNAKFQTELKTTMPGNCVEEASPSNIQATSETADITYPPSFDILFSQQFHSTSHMQPPSPCKQGKMSSEGTRYVVPGAESAWTNCEGPECHAMVQLPKHLCEECEEILRAFRANKTVNITSSTSFKPFGRAMRPQVRHGKPCLTQGCPKFGDPAHSNMCSSCFRRSQHLLSSQSGAQSKSKDKSEGELSLSDQNQWYLPSRILTVFGSVFHSQETPTTHEEHILFNQPSISTHPLKSEPFSQIATSASRAPQTSHTQQMVTTPLWIATSAPSTVSTSSNHEFSRLLQEVDLKTQLERKKCLASGCNNFGNPEKIGYCNVCYHSYKLQEEEFLRAQWPEDVVDSTSLKIVRDGLLTH